MNSFDNSVGADRNDSRPLKTMAGKPQILRAAKTVLSLNAVKFEEKLLCDGITLNLGDSCVYSCQFCYVEAVMRKLCSKNIESFNQTRPSNDSAILGHRDVVIRRQNALELLRSQLVRKNGKPRYFDINDKRVVFTSTLVDVAANMELLKETAAACNIILEQTNWDIRLLSKSSLLHLLVEKGYIDQKYCQRLIFGFSTGTLDDKIASAIETGTSLVSKRLESLHWLQDNKFRTFGMICPSLPQTDYDTFSRDICAAIRVEKCEDVWAEVINVRGSSLTRTANALRNKGFETEAKALEFSMENKKQWEDYSRATFEAHTKNIPADKLHFLQYVDARNIEWWTSKKKAGAVLLGKIAEENEDDGDSRRISKRPPSQELEVLNLTSADLAYRDEREAIVSRALSSNLEAARALHEIFAYNNGAIWRQEHRSFEDYCRAKWGYGKSHAYRLQECGDFVSQLKQSPIGDSLPLNENQVRPLLVLPKEMRVECWTGLIAKNGKNPLSGGIVAKATKAFAAEKKLVLRKKRSTRVTLQTARKALTLLREFAASLPASKRGKADRIRMYLGGLATDLET